MLIPRLPAVLIFPFGPRCILHLAIDLRERLKDVDMVTSDSQLWIQTTKVIKDSEFYHSEKKNSLQNKENYHETQTAKEMFNIFRVLFASILLSFRKKKLLFTSLDRSVFGKNCALCLVYRPRGRFLPIRTLRLMNNIYLFIWCVLNIWCQCLFVILSLVIVLRG